MDKDNQKKSEYLVNAIIKGKNLKADDYLKKIVTSKCKRRIKNVLAS